MKKALIVLVLLIILAACSTHNEGEITIKEALDKNTRINWYNKWEEPSSNSILEYLKALEVKEMRDSEYEFVYACCDMDDDGNKDIIIRSTNYCDTQFVVIKHGQKYYGVMLSPKEAEDFYLTGIVSGFGGEWDYYYKIEVVDDELKEKLLAKSNGFDSFIVHEKTVSEKEFDAWVKEKCAEIVQWSKYKAE